MWRLRKLRAQWLAMWQTHTAKYLHDHKCGSKQEAWNLEENNGYAHPAWHSRLSGRG